MKQTFLLYRRLFAFAWPYKWRAGFGILTGIVAGLSILGMLQSSIGILTPIERQAARRKAVEAPPAAAVAAVQPAPASTPAAVPATPADSPELADLKKLPGFSGFLKAANYLRVPLLDAKGAITWQFMLLMVLVLPLCMAVRTGAVYLTNYNLRWVGARVVVDIRGRLFDRLLGQSLRYFGRTDVGQLISRCTYDTNTIEGTVSQTVADLSKAPTEILCCLVFIIWMAVRNHMLGLIAVVIIVFPTIIVPIIVMGRYVKRYTKKSLERVSDLVSRMQEIFTGIRVVKAYHTETAEVNRFNNMGNTYFKAVVKAMRSELLMTPLMEFTGVTLGCIFLVVCYAQGIQLSQIVPVAFAAVLVYQPIKALAKVNNSLQRSAAAAERIFAILDTDTALKEKPDAADLPAFQDKIVFAKAGFAYDPQGITILDDINLTIPRGTVVAVVGSTGSGKTTMAGLLARFHDPTSGAVMLDGHDLRDLKIASVRRLVGVVAQETVLFNDTIANNIAYGSPGATREQIIEAARKANAHEFIMEKEEGYEYVAGDKGCNLSGGQRQRISIARAILRNPPILILDEATSALDSVTEKLVQEALYRLMEDRTVFVIAHRLSTIQHAHQICVLDQGRIVERGTHAELLAKGGLYRRLCDTQFGAAEPPVTE
jgi:subfamily B ATP-binding cassette protein MsbA